MAEEFQAGICGGTWWNSSKNVFAGCSSPCSMGVTADMGSFVWQNIDVVDMKARSCEESNTNNNNSNSTNNSVSDSSMVFGSVQKPQQADSDSGGSSILIDSTLQMMGFGLSSSTSSSDWNQAILRGSGRAESFNSMLQEDMNSRLSYRQETTGMGSSQIHKDWSPKSFTTAGEESSITNAFKPVNQDFSLDHQPLNAVASSSLGTSASYGYSPTLLQSLFEPEPPQLQPSLFNNRSMNYMSTANYSDGLSPAWSKLAPLLKPSLPKQQPGSLHFSNNTPFWNASATSLNNNRASFLPSSPSQFLVPCFEEVKPNCRNLSAKSSTEDARDSGSVLKKGINEPAFKRTRIETPSPLPTFKVRKEKLGDRITALQQLVSPFGKTDTASVLHEAIEYIKFLHEQVSVLSTPYMKQGAPIEPQQGKCDKSIESEGPKQDLRSRGLCLVPISSTFPVANETTPDFWTPTFGGTFR